MTPAYEGASGCGRQILVLLAFFAELGNLASLLRSERGVAAKQADVSQCFVSNITPIALSIPKA